METKNYSNHVSHDVAVTFAHIVFDVESVGELSDEALHQVPLLVDHCFVQGRQACVICSRRQKLAVQ